MVIGTWARVLNPLRRGDASPGNQDGRGVTGFEVNAPPWHGIYFIKSGQNGPDVEFHWKINKITENTERVTFRVGVKNDRKDC